MKRTTRHSNPLWVILTALMVAALACNVGAPDDVDVRPTSEPPDRATATTEPKEEPEVESTAEGVPTDEGPTEDVNPGNGLTRSQQDNLVASTVQILALVEVEGELQPIWSGSGTLISSSGLILTNAHVASPAARGFGEENPDALAVALVLAEDEPAVPSYLAEVRAVDGFLDLAVIQVTATLDGDEIDPDELDLPYVELGDSDILRIGDHLNILGFPGIGGDTLTFTTGNVSGFTPEEQVGNRAWLKTDATIAGGNSGGLGADDGGHIIGVPTRASAGGDGNITDCRVVQDTNGDGRVDEEDNCIPIGGFINGLRPVNLAVPLIDAVTNGLAYESPYVLEGAVTEAGSGSEQFGSLAWYVVNEEGRFSRDEPVDIYPSGMTIVLAEFDFSGMTDGQAWAESWSRNGEVVYEADYLWDQGEEGFHNTWFSDSGDPLPDGDYHLELYAGSELALLTQGDITVGGGGGVDPGGTEAPVSEGQVQLVGIIYDGDTNQVIEGAEFYVLLPGLTFEAWDGSEDGVYTWAETNSEGYYELPDLISRDTEYTVVVWAEGYRVKSGDGLVWTEAEGDIFQMDVAMVK